MVRIFLSLILLFLFTACTPEPEENEFTQLRKNMEKYHGNRFERSVEGLQQKKESYKYSNGSTSTTKINAEEERRAQEEEERQRWIAVGIDAEEAEDWKALGLTPKHAKRWKNTGLTYNTIAVLIREDVLPSEAVAFMNKEFDKNPKIFAAFSYPLFEFEASCQSILKNNDKVFPLINKKCHDYVNLTKSAMTSGHMADTFKDTDLSLEYVSKLRQLDNQKIYILRRMAQKYQEVMINKDSKNFQLFFPILESKPTKEEMFFISQNGLQKLKQTQRYKSYDYYEFWLNKEKKEEAARLAAIEEQRALKKAKEEKLKAEAYKMQAIAYNKMVASECGEAVTPVPSTGEKVHLEGEIKYVIGKRGSNIFAYIVKNFKDEKMYIVREPGSKRKVDRKQPVSWSALTVGRVGSVTLDDEDFTGTYVHYDEADREGVEYFPMLKFQHACKYVTKSLVAN